MYGTCSLLLSLLKEREWFKSSLEIDKQTFVEKFLMLVLVVSEEPDCLTALLTTWLILFPFYYVSYPSVSHG